MSSKERSSGGVIMRTDPDLIKPRVGLGIATASIFLAGEMAGSGVLALPSAVVSTGWKQYEYAKYLLQITVLIEICYNHHIKMYPPADTYLQDGQV